MGKLLTKSKVETHQFKNNYWCLVRYEEVCSGNGSVIRIYLRSIAKAPISNGVRIGRNQNFLLKNALNFKNNNGFYDHHILPGRGLPANIVKFKKEASGPYGIIDGIDWILSKEDRQLEGYFKEKLGFSWLTYIRNCRTVADEYCFS